MQIIPLNLDSVLLFLHNSKLAYCNFLFQTFQAKIFLQFISNALKHYITAKISLRSCSHQLFTAYLNSCFSFVFVLFRCNFAFLTDLELFMNEEMVFKKRRDATYPRGRFKLMWAFLLLQN